MRATIFWIPGPWPGRLAIVPRPRGGDWLDDETRAWHEAGVDVIVSLLESGEEADLGLTGERASSSALGLEFRSFPIPDRGVPRSREAAARFAGELVEALNAGQSVGIHCRQGIGRSALIAAAVLISSGHDVKSALREIGRARGLDVPETDAQRRWLTDFASAAARSYTA